MGNAHYGAGYTHGDVSTLRPFAFSFLVRRDGDDIMIFDSICIYLGIDRWIGHWTWNGNGLKDEKSSAQQESSPMTDYFCPSVYAPSYIAATSYFMSCPPVHLPSHFRDLQHVTSTLTTLNTAITGINSMIALSTHCITARLGARTSIPRAPSQDANVQR